MASAYRHVKEFTGNSAAPGMSGLREVVAFSDGAHQAVGDQGDSQQPYHYEHG